MRGSFLLVAFLAIALAGEAKFADTENFSGRNGFDCGACHTPQLDPALPPAEIHVDGVPPQWDINTTYALTVRVTGGPTPNPVPGRSQAGFDLEVDLGTLAAGPSMEGLLRFPDSQEATYTGSGTMVRQWNLTWTSPGNDSEPVDLHLWAAGLAANGNHNPDGPQTLGEVGDRHAKIAFTVPPAPAVIEAWNLRPPPIPTIAVMKAQYGPYDVRRVMGDAAQADVVHWRVDAQPWVDATGTRPFFFDLPPLSPGAHILEMRSSRGDISSPVIAKEFVELAVASPTSAQTSTLGPVLLPLIFLFAAIIVQKGNP